jgi:hypothetical protein
MALATYRTGAVASTGPDPYGYTTGPGFTLTPNPAPPKASNATNPGSQSGVSPGAAPSVSGTGLGVLAIAGLGAIALANTKVGPVVIAALVAAVIWNGQALVGVVSGKAASINLGSTGAGVPNYAPGAATPSKVTGQLSPGYPVQPA